MVKKTLIYSVGTVSVLLAIALFWQPDSWKTLLLRNAVSEATESAPYRLYFARVRGSFITGLTLDTPRLVLRTPRRAELLRAQAVRLGLNWPALWHKRIVIAHFELVNPVIHVIIGPDQHVLFPAAAPPAKSKFAVGIQDFRITGGSLLVTNEAFSPPAVVKFDDLEVRATLAPGELTVEELKLRLEKGRLSGNGKFGTAPANPAARWDMRTENWPFQKLLAIIRQEQAPLRLTHTGSWLIRYSKAGTDIESHGQLDKAPLTASAHFSPRGYAAQVQLDALSTQHLWTDPRSENAVISASMTVSAPTLTSRQINGEGIAALRTGPAALAQAQFHLSRGQGPGSVTVAMEGFNAQAHAALDVPALRAQGRFQLEVSSFTGLSALFPPLRDAAGHVTASGSFQGEKKLWKGEGHALAEPLIWKTYRVGHMDAELKLAARGKQVIAMTVDGVTFRSPGESPYDLQTATLKLNGEAASWTTSLHAACRNGLEVDSQGRLRRAAPGWAYLWNSLQVKPGANPVWSSARPGKIVWEGPGNMSMENFFLQQGGQALAIPYFALRDNRYRVRAKGDRIALAPWMKLISPEPLLDGILTARVNLEGTAKALNGDVSANLLKGTLRRWPYEALQAQIRLQSPWVEFQPVRLISGSKQTLQIDGRMPQSYMTGEFSTPLALHLNIRAPFIDPAMLAALWPEALEAKGGALSLVFSLRGRWPHPVTEGRFSGKIPRFTLKPVGVDMEDLDIDVQDHQNVLMVERFHGRTKRGAVDVTGHSRLPELDLALKAEDLRVKIADQIKGSGEVALQLSGRVTAPQIRGAITLYDGVYNMEPPKKKGKKNNIPVPAPTIPDAASQPPPRFWLATDLDVRTLWDRDVWYRDGVSSVETRGDIRIQKPTESPKVFLTGSVTALRGTYNYYGKDFNIESAQIQFTGPPEINPLLNIEASYQSEGTLVYLDVTGSSKKPVLKMRSNPPLPDQDIISVLVFGRPLNELTARTGSSTTNQQMASIAGSVVGSYVTKGLRQTGIKALDLDVLNFQSTPEGSQMTVGRYLTRNLFVSYDQTLSTTGQRGLQAEYFLSDNWTLQGEAGSADVNHLDFLFRYPLNRRSSKGLGSFRQSPFRQRLDNPNSPFLSPAPVAVPAQ